jgi:hypothetical protein
MASSLLISIAPYYPIAFRGPLVAACLPVTLDFPARVAGAWPVSCHPSGFMPGHFTPDSIDLLMLGDEFLRNSVIE